MQNLTRKTMTRPQIIAVVNAQTLRQEEQRAALARNAIIRVRERAAAFPPEKRRELFTIWLKAEQSCLNPNTTTIAALEFVLAEGELDVRSYRAGA